MHGNSDIYKAIHPFFKLQESFFEQEIHVELKEEII